MWEEINRQWTSKVCIVKPEPLDRHSNRCNSIGKPLATALHAPSARTDEGTEVEGIPLSFSPHPGYQHCVFHSSSHAPMLLASLLHLPFL